MVPITLLAATALGRLHTSVAHNTKWPRRRRQSNSPEQRGDRLAARFKSCSIEKNCTLVRYDIIQDFRNLYDAVKDEKVKEKALALIETEPDSKYRKKYAGLWRL